MTKWFKCSEYPLPKDRPILIIDLDLEFPTVVKFKGAYMEANGEHFSCIEDITHWAELPEPPEEL